MVFKNYCDIIVDKIVEDLKQLDIDKRKEYNLEIYVNEVKDPFK